MNATAGPPDVLLVGRRSVGLLITQTSRVLTVEARRDFALSSCMSKDMDSAVF